VVADDEVEPERHDEAISAQDRSQSAPITAALISVGLPSRTIRITTPPGVVSSSRVPMPYLAQSSTARSAN
jgi:hypothetical protein